MRLFFVTVDPRYDVGPNISELFSVSDNFSVSGRKTVFSVPHNNNVSEPVHPKTTPSVQKPANTTILSLLSVTVVFLCQTTQFLCIVMLDWPGLCLITVYLSQPVRKLRTISLRLINFLMIGVSFVFQSWC